MKILVISDTHGRQEELRKLISRVKPIDYLIHAGDVEGAENEIRQMAGCPCVIVRGNNDYFCRLENEEILTIGRHRFYITHGHRLGVSGSPAHIAERAKAHDCEAAVFGHTHMPCLDQTDPELTLLNPGSLERPRQSGRRKSFAVINIDRFDEVHYTLNYI